MTSLPYNGPGIVKVITKPTIDIEMVNEEEAIITMPTRVNLRKLWESTFYNCFTSTSPWVHVCEQNDFAPDATAELWIDNPDWDESMYIGEEEVPNWVWSWNDLPEDYKEQSTLRMHATVQDLVKAYGAILAERKYHCGVLVSPDTDDWDSCCTDYMIQYMFFGKLIYG